MSGASFSDDIYHQKHDNPDRVHEMPVPGEKGDSPDLRFRRKSTEACDKNNQQEKESYGHVARMQPYQPIERASEDVGRHRQMVVIDQFVPLTPSLKQK